MMTSDEKSLQLQKDESSTSLPLKKENDGEYEQSIIYFLEALKNSLSIMGF